MLRAIVLFPQFPDPSELDAIRSAYDPLASKIAPHITLVFPFESPLRTEELTHHVRAAVVGIGAFDISLGMAQARPGEFIWLPVMRGRSEVLSLHNALYQGPLSLYLDRSRPYEPHLTVGRVQGNSFDAAYEAARTLSTSFEARIHCLHIEAIMPDETSCVESVVSFSRIEPR